MGLWELECKKELWEGWGQDRDFEGRKGKWRDYKEGNRRRRSKWWRREVRRRKSTAEGLGGDRVD